MKLTIISKREYPELKKLRAAFDTGKNGDMCVAVGGDGTFMRAAAEFDGPILPIRTKEKGSVGYYSDIDIKDIDLVIRNLKNGAYDIEELSKGIEISYKNKKYVAVNEAVLNNVLQEVSFRIYEISDGRKGMIYPYVMSGDGILITSVVGSTAYNKSAGGPIILSPNVFCITFLNVDGPYNNPIVVDSKMQIEIEIVKYRGRLHFDGKEIGILNKKDKFRVRLSDKSFNIVKIRNMTEDFGSKLERIITRRMEK
ncbi:MAG: NAD(+)/NADH kinase [Candidatus Marsarchaeota archaeon]|jgi:NAD+ kinase|nr:NAD(+)/NADH kinase [Candidatus Marsarchaeota archaeon]